MTRAHVEPEWAMLTVAFVDIRGFTRFADHATAREAAAYLDEFFATVIPVVHEHGGHVNQLLGDGLLAVFDSPDHADRALAGGARSDPPSVRSSGTAAASGWASTRGWCSWARSGPPGRRTTA